MPEKKRSWLPTLFRRPAPPATTGGLYLRYPDPGFGLGDKAGTGRTRLMSVGSGLQAGNSTYGGSERMRDYASYLGAITIPAVYMACSVIAYNYAAAMMRVYNLDGEVVNVRRDHPDLFSLLEQPNKDVDGFTFREYMAMDMELCGNSIIALDSWVAGRPTEMYRLRPDKIRIGRDKRNMDLIYGYEVSQNGMTQPVWYDEEEILHQKMANPLDPLWGMGIIEAGEVAFSTDRRINEFLLAYFDRGAILDGVLTTEGDMSDAEYDRLLNRWRAAKGTGRADFRTAILWQGASYQPIQEPLGNVPIVDFQKMARNEIFQMFGVPPAKVGDFSGTNYRNAQEADAFFLSETLTPLLRRSESIWTKLVRYWDEDYSVRFDVREVVDYVNRAITAQRLASTGAFTRNDIRTAGGYEPLPENDPLGQQFLTTLPGFNVIDPISGESVFELPETPGALTDHDEPSEPVKPAPLKPGATPGGTETPAKPPAKPPGMGAA